MLRSLPLFALLACVGARAESAPTAVLLAHSGEAEVWQVELSGSAAKCRVKGEGNGKTLDQTPPKKECGEMYGLLELAAKALVHAPAKSTHHMDEPDYRLTVGDRSGAVDFDSPQVCAVRPNGSLDCKPHELSGAQRLMLHLRAFGQELAH